MPASSATSEWHPDAREGAWWTLVSLVLVIVGLAIFSVPLFLRSKPADIELAPKDVAVLAALTAMLIVLHEGIHGMVMRSFGARPFFGVAMAAKIVPALYTTAPGYRFSRPQYLAVSLTPAIAISLVGFAVSFSAAGPFLFVPLALHLGGCAGDAAATWQVLRQPRGTIYEDLRDGIRFHRPSPGGVSIT